MRDSNTHHKKSTITLLITSALVVLTGATAGILGALNAKNDDPAQKVTASQRQDEVQPATTVRFTAVAGKTVLDQLRTHAGEVTVKSSSYGPFVEAINGVKGGTDNKYWTYYVDGQMANIGAGEYTTKGGEEVVWKFE